MNKTTFTPVGLMSKLLINLFAVLPVIFIVLSFLSGTKNGIAGLVYFAVAILFLILIYYLLANYPLQIILDESKITIIRYLIKPKEILYKEITYLTEKIIV
jgi:hypothetical protein